MAMDNCKETSFLRRVLYCATPTNSSSNDGLSAAISIASASLLAQVLIFIMLRTRFKGIYSPKVYVSARERVTAPPDGPLGWLRATYMTRPLAEKCGLDAFFFLRFLQLQLKIFLPAAAVILPILLPINLTGGGDQDGLYKYSFSNVRQPHRVWAHLICGMLFIAWVCYLVYHELTGYVSIRQTYLTSPQHRLRASATTVLVCGIPEKWRSLTALHGLFDVLQGGVHTIWVNRDYSKLAEKVKYRGQIAQSLENAETALIKQCFQNEKTKPQNTLEGIASTYEMVDLSRAQNLPTGASLDSALITQANEAPVHDMTPKPTEGEYPEAYNKECDEDQDNEPEWRRYIKPTDRQTIRLPILSWLPSIPFVGKKVDRIYWHRRELARLNLEIESDQSNPDKYPYMNSAFVQFNSQVAAHMCCQSLIHHLPTAMTPRIVEISPNDVLWNNLSMAWWERYLRTGVTLLSCAALIVCYAFPVAFTGLLSNINTLTQTIHWLSWLSNAPSPIQSAIQGLLPQVILNTLLVLVPVLFRSLIHQQGVPTGNAKERAVQTWYFAFLFIQVFLVVTLSTGLYEFGQQLLTNPGMVFQSLARSVPPAATYFFSYLTVQALSNSASNLLQPFGLLSLVLARLNDSTARDKWKRRTEPNVITWGSFFPLFTLFATVGLIYSITAPLILVFMLLIFSTCSIVYRYNILFVYRSINDTGGLLFPVALNQMLTGLYVLEICLIGLFFAMKEDGNFQCLPQAVIMILVLAGTILYQWQLNVVFEPLFNYLPISLEDDAVIQGQQQHGVRATAEDTPGSVLYGNYADELEDLSAEERQAAVRTAFQPEALRATRPVIWIPRDPLGVRNDEIRRAGKMSAHLWMSNEGAALNAKGCVEFSAPPPDFSSRDLIVL